MIPKTYLCTAPSDATDPFGRMLTHTEVIAGLQRANPRIWAPTEGWQTWSTGRTSIWLGQPLLPGSKKICAFQLGPIPEFSQIGPDSRVMARGWRAILERVVAMHAAPRHVLERIFNVTLGFDGKDRNCHLCRRSGKAVRAETAGGLCASHSQAERWAKHQRAAAQAVIGASR